MITVNSQMHGNVQVISVGGRVDGYSAPQLDEALQNALKAKHYKIVVDLKDTEFLSSAGMRALLKARLEAQDQRGELRLANPSQFIMDALKLVGLEKLFKIYNSQQAALTEF
ncbi:MAG TPA: STAS domain-containing protein [Anaerolineae bacterium]|nr:STAS domain-containing protein [Anaerolineae bacterium]